MKLVIGIVVVAVVALGGFLLFSDGSSETLSTDDSNVSAKDALPNAEVIDEDGNKVDIHSLALGKPAVVNSWATWCPFCVDELPDFAQLQEEFGDKITVIAVNRNESLSQANSYTEDLSVAGKMRFLQDPGDDWYRTIGGFSMPETIFTNSKGEIILHKRGPLAFKEMKSIVDSIIEEEN